MARLIKQHDWPMVLNCVLHRHNLPHVRKIIDMAVALEAEYQLANTQYYGWAWISHDHPTPTQEEPSKPRRRQPVSPGATNKTGPRTRVLFVVPDYFEERPKACMNGWVPASVAPDGLAMPATTRTAHRLPSVKDTLITTSGNAARRSTPFAARVG
ncbi:MAG: hypothetical protein R3E42_09500 [Burkholderiaceae bacterium]